MWPLTNVCMINIHHEQQMKVCPNLEEIRFWYVIVNIFISTIDWTISSRTFSRFSSQIFVRMEVFTYIVRQCILIAYMYPCCCVASIRSHARLCWCSPYSSCESILRCLSNNLEGSPSVRPPVLMQLLTSGIKSNGGDVIGLLYIQKIRYAQLWRLLKSTIGKQWMMCFLTDKYIQGSVYIYMCGNMKACISHFKIYFLTNMVGT